MTMPRSVERGIVILDIDEKSLGEIGRWPWSRKLMAETITKLFDRHGIAVLGFDVVFAERDPSSGIETLDALAQGELKQAAGFQQAYRELRPKLDNDALFAAAMKGRPVVLGYYFNSEEKAVRANAPPSRKRPAAPAGRDAVLWVAVRMGNPPIFQLVGAAGAGHQSRPGRGDAGARADAAEFDGKTTSRFRSRCCGPSSGCRPAPQSRSGQVIPRATTPSSGCGPVPTPSRSTSTPRR
jgi:hypothetical protein